MKDVKSIEATRHKFNKNRFGIFLACIIVQDFELFNHYEAEIDWIYIKNFMNYEFDCLLALCNDIRIIRYFFGNKSLDCTSSICNILCYSNNLRFIEALYYEYPSYFDSIFVLFCSYCNSDIKVYDFVQKKSSLNLEKITSNFFKDNYEIYMQGCISIQSLELLQRVMKFSNKKCFEICCEEGNISGVQYYFGKLKGNVNVVKVLEIMKENIYCDVVDWLIDQLKPISMKNKQQIAEALFSTYMPQKMQNLDYIMQSITDLNDIKNDTSEYYANQINHYESCDMDTIKSNIHLLMSDKYIYELEKVCKGTQFDVYFLKENITNMGAYAFQYFISNSTFNLSDIESNEIKWTQNKYLYDLSDYSIFLRDSKSFSWLQKQLDQPDNFVNFILEHKIVGNILNKTMMDKLPYEHLIKLFENNVYLGDLYDSDIFVDNFEYPEVDFSKRDILFVIGGKEYYGDSEYFRKMCVVVDKLLTSEVKYELKCDMSNETVNTYILLSFGSSHIEQLSLLILVELLIMLKLYPLRSINITYMEYLIANKIENATPKEMEQISKYVDLYEFKYIKMKMIQKLKKNLL